MTISTQYLKTQQVADALGISVSTVKRWVDKGELYAAKTVGKHRLISVDEALKFARKNRLSTANLERLDGSGLSALASIDDLVRDGLFSALKEGRTRDAKHWIESAYRACGGAAVIADELIGPVMGRVGHGWSVGDWDIFEEHHASQVVASVLSDLIARVSPASSGHSPLALGAAPEGDAYILPLLLGELTLRDAGWDVKNLGANLPLKSLARAITLYRPRLIFLAVSHMIDPIGFLGEYAELSELAFKMKATLVVGGRGLSPELLARLEHTVFGERMINLRDVARDLHSGPSVIPSEHGMSN